MKKKWHAVDGKETLRELESGEDGLSWDEASRRRDKYGKNRLPEKKRAGLFKIIFRQMKDPLVYILLIAGAVSLGIGNLNNAIFIFAVLFFNTSIGAFQEYKAETSAKALQSVMKVRVDVLRGGKKKDVDSEDLVPGDIVFVKSGASVPADIRLLDSRDLRADESLLTGESVPVDKKADEVLEKDTSLGDRSNMIHAGTSIMSGRGRGIVCRTGTETEVGRIAESLTEESQQPPLVVKLNKFTRQIGVIVLAAVTILGVVQFTRGVEITEIFFLGVALSVSAIPAGLPVAITVAMAIASNRMAKRNVIVRQLPAVEGLGSCTLIASDKTGTLTANKLTIKRLRAPDGNEFEVTGGGYDPEGKIVDDNGIDDDTLIG
jgi:P-type E1-E2 ATPase